MAEIFLSLVAVFVLLIMGEALWRTKRIKGEIARKFIHISVGTFVAFWPFYMSFAAIQLIALAFLFVVLGSRYLNIFKSVHTIDRQTWGDVLFAVGVLITACLTDNQWVFLAAILHLSLADGLAAVMGNRFGKKNEYKVLGATKSVIGTTTFWLISVAILCLVFYLGADGQLILALPLLGWLPLMATVLENTGVYGMDNITVPLLLVVTLSQVQFVF